LIVGNWKMHGRASDLDEARALATALTREPAAAQVVVCPPATLLAPMRDALRGGPIALGGQTCHAEAEGPFTGEISAAMLSDAGARYVIVGHSERRRSLGERDEDVAAQAEAAAAAGLQPIICLGDTLKARRSGQTAQVLQAQAAASIPADLKAAFAVAYEPAWAIGGDRTPTSDEIVEAHAAIRAVLRVRLRPVQRPPILYGGSVTAENAGAIAALRGVGGLLVGRASLKAADFLAVIRAAAGSGDLDFVDDRRHARR
jgi:triosephosphate isomerase